MLLKNKNPRRIFNPPTGKLLSQQAAWYSPPVRGNKKGNIYFPEELVKIVLAVIGLFFLFLIAYSLYNIFFNKTEIEQARAVLTEVDGKIKMLQEGTERKVVVTAPKGWYLVYYDKDIVNADPKKGMPKQCEGKNCICMCAYGDIEGGGATQTTYDTGRGNIDYFYYSDRALGGCEKTNICSNYDDAINIDNVRFYKVPKMLNVDSLGNANWISLYNLPKNIYLRKEQGKIIISEKSAETSFISGLLSQKVKLDSGMEVNFEDLVKTVLGNNCNFYEGKISYQSKDGTAAKKALGNYLEMWKLKSSNFEGRISVLFVNKDESINAGNSILVPYAYGAGTYVTEETKQICNKDFSIYIRFEKVSVK
jgi:hypothetical protein